MPTFKHLSFSPLPFPDYCSSAGANAVGKTDKLWTIVNPTYNSRLELFGSFDPDSETGTIKSIAVKGLNGDLVIESVTNYASLSLEDFLDKLDQSSVEAAAYLFAGADTIYGSEDFNYIEGFGGNDLLDGGSETDNLYGGADDDTILGGGGNDYLYGDDGKDTLTGGVGMINSAVDLVTT